MYHAAAAQHHHNNLAFLALRICAAAIICVGLWSGSCEGNAIRKPATTNNECAKFDEYCINHWDCCSNSCLSFVYRCTRNLAFDPVVFIGQNYPAQATLEDILEANFGDGKQEYNVTVLEHVPLPPTEQIDLRIRLGNEIETTVDEGTRATTFALPTNELNNNIATTPSMHNQEQKQQKQQQSITDAMQSNNLITTTTTTNTLEPVIIVETPSTSSLPSSSSSSLTSSPSSSSPPSTTTTKTIVASTINTLTNMEGTSLETRSTSAETETATAKATTTTSAETAKRETAAVDCKEIGEKCYRHEECCSMRCHGFLHQCVT